MDVVKSLLYTIIVIIKKKNVYTYTYNDSQNAHIILNASLTLVDNVNSYPAGALTMKCLGLVSDHKEKMALCITHVIEGW